MFCDNELAKRNLPPIWPDAGQNWESRRKEIADILQREMFGFRPADPEEISFEEMDQDYFFGTDRVGNAPVRKIKITSKINGKYFSFPVYSLIPEDSKCLPFFIHIGFRSDNTRKSHNEIRNWFQQPEEIISGGFALFYIGYEDVTSDDMDFTDGLAGVLYEGKERTGGDPGKIPMWSWAASRAMDYCQTLDCLDFTKSAVIGHSRLGKTALYTGMMDERFKFSISNCSGYAGAAISRNRHDRERGKPFCSTAVCVERHMQWFSENYRKYADNEEAMPYDQHFLVAASAPRAVYVGTAVKDTWSDPDTQYLSACAAGEVYERLGKPGLFHPDRYPIPGDVFHEGLIGFHMREGGHDQNSEDWHLYMQYIRNTLVPD